MASSPRILNSRQTGTDQTPKLCKSPPRSSSSLRVLRRQGAAKHKLARRQAAKLCYCFGPLTPFCALREPDRADGTKNGFPAPNKEPTTNQKTRLDRKSPIQVRIRFPPAKGLQTISSSTAEPITADGSNAAAGVSASSRRQILWSDQLTRCLCLGRRVKERLSAIDGYWAKRAPGTGECHKTAGSRMFRQTRRRAIHDRDSSRPRAGSC